MRRSTFSLLALLAAILLIPVSYGSVSRLEITEADWKEWKQRHQKMYGDESEEYMRRSVWLDNFEKITAHNQAGLGFSLELNEFADMVSNIMQACICIALVVE